MSDRAEDEGTQGGRVADRRLLGPQLARAANVGDVPMTAEQEREQLIKQAAATLFPAYFSATLVSESAKELAREAAARLVNAGWRPPPPGDVVGEVASFISGVTGLHGEAWAVVSDVADDREIAQSLAEEGYLRIPGCYDPIECGHEAALGEAEAKLEELHAHDCAQHPQWARAHDRQAGQGDWLIGNCRCEECRIRQFKRSFVEPDEETVERVARAAYEGGFLKAAVSEGHCVTLWEGVDDAARESWRDVARAALCALGGA